MLRPSIQRALVRVLACVLVLAMMLALILALVVPGYAAPAQTDLYYLLEHDGRQELVDRQGNPPAALEGRTLDNRTRRVYVGYDSRQAVLGYALCAQSEDAEVEVLYDGWGQEVYQTERAFMLPGGELLFPFTPGASYLPLGNYVAQRTLVHEGAMELTVADPATGREVARLTDRYIEDLGTFGDGYYALTRDIENGRIVTKRGRSTFVIYDEALREVAAVSCSYGWVSEWAGEPVAMLRDADENSFVIDAKGNTLAGPFEGAPYAYLEADASGQTQLILSRNGGRELFLVDKATGAETLLERGGVTAHAGGLATYWTQPSKDGQAGGEYVEDAQGCTILPSQGCSYYYTETSPVLAVRYGQETNSCALYSREGALLVDWLETDAQGALDGDDSVYLVAGGYLNLFAAPGSGRSARIPLPEGTEYGWPGVYSGRLTFEYRVEGMFIEALISKDRQRIEPEEYVYFYPFDAFAPGGDFIALKRQGEREFYGMIDNDGNMLIPFRFTRLRQENDLYAATQGRWYGLVDRSGTWVLRYSRLDALGE